MAKRVEWTPNPGPQSLFVTAPLDVKDICYGGARGGAKTIGLIMGARRYEADYPGKLRGVIFRKTYPELEEIVHKATMYLVKQLGWKPTYSPHPTFKAPTGGTLMLRNLEDMADALTYDGREFNYLGFDELGNWPDPAPVDYMLGTLRSGEGLPCVRRSTCMPGGPGHAWVKERYDPERGSHELEFESAARKDLKMKSFFILAKLEDNPKINREEYEVSLAFAGSPALYRAWREGKWDIVAGAYFDLWDEAKHTFDERSLMIQPWWPRWIAMDWGFKDDTVIGWYCKDDQDHIWRYRERKTNQKTPEQIGQLIVDASKLPDGSYERLSYFFLSPDAFAQRQSPKTIAAEIGEVLKKHGLPEPTRADNDRIGGWQLIYQMLYSGKLHLGKQGRELNTALPLLQRNLPPKDIEDIAPHAKDHAPDELRYALKTYVRDAKIPKENLIDKFIADRMGQFKPQPADAPEGWVDPDPSPYQLDGRGNILNRPKDHPLQPKAPTGPIDFNRVYLLEQMAIAKNRRSAIRPKARVFGRRYV